MFQKMLKGTLRKTGYRISRYYSVPATIKLLAINNYFTDICGMIEEVDGSIVELGFGRGDSFMVLANLSQKNNRVIYGFDSFEGFPNPSVFDVSARKASKGQWSIRTIDEAKKQIASWGLTNTFQFDKIHLVKGFVEDTVPIFASDKTPLALIHINLNQDMISK